MDWSAYPIPPMRHEARFGDRVVLAFSERPKSIWEMVESAAARNPDGEALICGERRMTWRHVVPQSAQTPKFVRRYGNLGPAIDEAVEAYASDVRSRAFPAAEHVYAMKKS